MTYLGWEPCLALSFGHVSILYPESTLTSTALPNPESKGYIGIVQILCNARLLNLFLSSAQAILTTYEVIGSLATLSPIDKLLPSTSKTALR